VAQDPITGVYYTDFDDMFTVGAGIRDVAAALANYDRGMARLLAASFYNSVLKIATLTTNVGETWWSSPTW